MLPDAFSKYFWDVQIDKISLDKNGKFIIERLLEYGDKKEFDWLEKHFDKNKIVDTIKNSKKISSKTGNFFALYYDIPKQELECIRKPFTQRQNRF